MHYSKCYHITIEEHYGARYKRIRKRPRGIPLPQLVEIKTFQLRELVNLWHQGYIDLRFGDESHVCTSEYVPYGWHFDGEDVFVPCQGKHRLNIFGMISPGCITAFYTSPKAHWRIIKILLRGAISAISKR